MRELRQVISDNTYRFGRVIMYIDVCHAGAIEHSPYKDAPPEDAGMEPETGVWGLMAASKRAEKDKAEEYAYEADALQHGIFTYYLLSGLAGGAPKTGNMILFGTLEELVAAQVKAITSNIQEPKGYSSSAMAVVDDASAHFDFPRVELKVPLQITGQRSAKRNGQKSPLPVREANVADYRPSASGFETMLRPDRLSANLDGVLWALEQMPPNERDRFRPRFRAALEDAGQLVLLTYLQGDQVPQTQYDFERGAKLFAQAWQLTDCMNAFDEARMLFCQGRALIFAKRYTEADKLLQHSIRLEPSRSYAYNALGISYLEQIPLHPQLLSHAIAAFRDARTLEPYWAYPIHNLALAYAQQGNNDQAIEAYREAMRIAPAYSYLPYNLGLLYERLNQADLAEKNFHLAVKRAEMRAGRLGISSENWVERAAPLNALSTLYLNEGRRRLAAKELDAALTADPTYVPALHNKGIVLAARGRRQEAILQWRRALALDSEYLPARISLAEALLATHDFDHASLEYREILNRKPKYVAARRALALVLVSMNRLEAALEELNQALVDNPGFAEAAAERNDLIGILSGHHPHSEAIKRAIASRERE
jgi:tetratricopeptide (TPR) repeat protein